MKSGKFFNLTITLAFAALLSSCGPMVHFFNVDERVPARIPLEFGNDNIAVFSTITSLTDSAGNKTLNFERDSLLMVKIASGLASGIEENMALDSGTIPVFNHYGNRWSDLVNPSYIESLSLNSGAELMFVLENLQIESLKILRLTGSQLNNSPAVSYVYMPISVDVGVYDGINRALLASHNKKDTIYWEIFSKQDLREDVIQSRLYESLTNLSTVIGGQLAREFFPTWNPQERYLYTFSRTEWLNALKFSDEFKWREAMHIWLMEVESNNRMKSSAAAFNIAVSCEMMEKYDLAIDWLDYAKKSFPLEGIDGYKTILTRKLEKQK